MKRTIALTLVALVATAYAQEDPQLASTATAPAVQRELSNPDGVAIAYADDGSWKIYARGEGSYDFNDPDDIRDARSQGEARAKVKLVKFLKEAITASDGLDRIAKKTKNLSSDGQTERGTVTKEDVTVLSESIRVQAESILAGVIALSEERMPMGSGGVIQVTIGFSSKTLAATKFARQGINRALDDSAPAPQAVPAVERPLPPRPALENKYQLRKSDTDF